LRPNRHGVGPDVGAPAPRPPPNAPVGELATDTDGDESIKRPARPHQHSQRNDELEYQ
jgi:hypothetical protein